MSRGSVCVRGRFHREALRCETFRCETGPPAVRTAGTA